MSEAPLCSIICLTYNSRPYIRQTLESFVAQRTSFPFEVVIGDDGSDDGTVEICREYADKYSEIINFETMDRRESLAFGKVIGGLNFVRTVASCRGKYISICEGDDFLSGPDTLEQQVDFLESHSDYAMVHGRGTILIQEEELLCSSRKFEAKTMQGNVYNALMETNFIITCTVCMAAEKIRCFAKMVDRNRDSVLFCDYFWWLSLAAEGDKIGYIDKPWGTYRIHKKSMSNKGGFESTKKNIRGMFGIREYFRQRYGAEYTSQEMVLYYLMQMMNACRGLGEKDKYEYYRNAFEKRLIRWLDRGYNFQPDTSVMQLEKGRHGINLF